jgi:tRNA G18 (ribose-2'-O)-methylase SpoU
MGVDRVYFSGYTPYPTHYNDERLPHLRNKLHTQIHKTALGAQNYLSWSYHNDINVLINHLKDNHYKIVGLEQNQQAISLPAYQVSDNKIALIVGREVEGIEASILEQCDEIVEIPLYGKKESLNVVQAAAITLYVLRES